MLPLRRLLLLNIFGPARVGCLADPAAFAVASRMGGEVEQKIFPHERPEIDRLGSVQLGMDCKRRNFDLVNEFFETGDAAQLDRLTEGAIGPERAIGHAKIEIILKRSSAPNAFRFEIWNQAIVFTLQMQPFGRNLFEMNLHSRIVSEFTS